tara:strand:- start:151 stop:549 length:399 start_codon:yes stop_codon:yes gene_type:complete
MLGAMERFVKKSFVVTFYARASGIRKLSVIYHQYYDHFDGHSRQREKTDDCSQVMLGTSWECYTLTFKVRDLEPKTNSVDLVASFGFLILYIDAGPDHDDRTQHLGHQSGDFEFADVKVEGLGAVNLSQVFS